MKLTETDNRLMESQRLLREVMSEAIGIYMAKEPSEKDGWRDVNLWQLDQHLKHEHEEVNRSNTPDRLYHNLLDSIVLTAMLAVRVREGNV